MLPISITSRSTARKGEQSITHLKMIKIFQGKSHTQQDIHSSRRLLKYGYKKQDPNERKITA